MTVWTRRGWLALAAAATLLAGCASAPDSSALPPIVFVHGNGDSAALWGPTLWRYESNGWPRERLVAVDLPYPLARDDDTVDQPGRSSAEANAKSLAVEVERVLRSSGASKVVLVGNSRGGNAIRHYVQYLGGGAHVERVVLGGTPSHGVWANPADRPNNEFNGAGPYLTALNAPKGPNGDEVTPGVAWLTLRSDNNDKFAQPDGAWIGQRGKPTNVSFDGPALKGATNRVLPGRDHRETSYHAESFARSYEFITGRPPATTAITPEARPLLDGMISSSANLPIEGARIEVYAVDERGQRIGDARHRQAVGANGRWGPFAADPMARYEFVVSAPGYAITHVYRSPFPRSSSVVHFRPERLADADKDALSLLLFTRPRGYFGLPRDRIVFDGQPPPGIAPGVAGLASSKLKLREGEGRAVVAEYGSGEIAERLVGRAWPTAGNHVVVLELTH